jgi:hypothetical protein
LGPKVLKLSAERSAGVRKLFRLVQLEQVAERIVQEGLCPARGMNWILILVRGSGSRRPTTTRLLRDNEE